MTNISPSQRPLIHRRHLAMDDILPFPLWSPPPKLSHRLSHPWIWASGARQWFRLSIPHWAFLRCAAVPATRFCQCHPALSPSGVSPIATIAKPTSQIWGVIRSPSIRTSSHNLRDPDHDISGLSTLNLQAVPSSPFVSPSSHFTQSPHVSFITSIFTYLFTISDTHLEKPLRS